MHKKNKVLVIAVLLLVSVVLSGCLSNSAENVKANSNQSTEKPGDVPVQKESTEKVASSRVAPNEVVTQNDTNKTAPANETPATQNKVVSASLSGSSSSSGSSSTSSSDNTNKITVTDDLGRSITVPYPCEKTVFLVENAMNSMYAVGGTDKISGIGAVWFEDTKAPFFRAIDSNYDKKRLSNGSEQPTNEKIATANPQVVFLWAADWASQDIKSIEENLNVPVYAVFIDSLDDLQRQMKTLSKMIGNEARGDEVIGIMNESMKKVTDVTGSLIHRRKTNGLLDVERCIWHLQA